jgi:hypothetical protein
MSLIAPAAEKLGPRGDAPPADYLAQLEQASIINTLGNLLTFPRLRKLISTAVSRCTEPILRSRPASCWCSIRTPGAAGGVVRA